MKPVLICVLALFCTANFSFALDGNVETYLASFASFSGSSVIFNDDRILSLDLDLNNDGAKETLVSMARNRNGKQGNVWNVYKANGSSVGIITFSPSRFYIGALEGEKYGLATFGPAGAGEGTMWGYVFDGKSIQQIALGNVVLNRKTMKLEGEEIINKFLGEKAIVGEDFVTSIGAAELASKYGVKIDPRTYQQALAEEMSASPSTEQTKPSPIATQVTHVPPTASPMQQPKSLSPDIPSPSTTVAESKSTTWPWIIGAILLLAAAGGIVLYLLRRKST